MKNTITLIGWAVAILFCTLFLLKCDHKNPVKLEYKSIHDTIKKNIIDTTHRKPILVYKPIYKDGTVKYIKGDTVFYPVKSMYLSTGDTLEIVEHYLMTNIYSGNFSKDSVNITWIDSVSHNKSLGHKFIIQNLRPTMLNNNISKRMLYLGGTIGWSLNNRLPSLTPIGVYLDKKDRGFILSYDLVNRTAQFGIIAKIHLK